jgi:hypothetical protein
MFGNTNLVCSLLLLSLLLQMFLIWLMLLALLVLVILLLLLMLLNIWLNLEASLEVGFNWLRNGAIVSLLDDEFSLSESFSDEDDAKGGICF